MSDDHADAQPVASRLRLLALVGAVGTIALVALYFLVLRKDYVVLVADARPQDAAAVVETLEKQSIPYRLAAGGSQIRVPAEQVDVARLELASSGSTLGGVEGFELFNDSDMGLSDYAQRVRYQRALQGEIARTIMTMEGVADARVHITMPERSLFRSERRNAEAAVTLIMRGEQQVSADRIEGIQRLVAAATPDLLVADVVVLNAKGETISPSVEMSLRNDVGLQGYVVDDAPAIDTVLSLVRRALPSQRFEVTIEPVIGDLAGAATIAPSSPAFLVTVTTARRLSDNEMEQVSMTLRAGGVIDGDTNGTVQFRIAPPQTPVEPISATSEPASARQSRIQRPESIAPWIGLAALVFLFVVIIAFIARRSRPSLGEDEQERFAARLREMLQGVPDNV
jgi:flagellar M-ring protein FliF